MFITLPSFEKKFNLKFCKLLFICFSFLLYFFMNNINYSYSLQKNNEIYLIPIGKVIQIDGELENLIVRTEVIGCPLKSGDLILKADGKTIKDFDNLSDIFYSSNSNQLSLTIKRKSEIKNLICYKESLKKVNFNNAISGFATLTYIDPKTNHFGAVGHSINIGGTNKIPLKLGTISSTTNLDIQKSSRGNVGCINASKDSLIGNFRKNTQYGITGNIKDLDMCNQKKYKVASLDEIQPGKAQILLQNKQNKCQTYDIEILKIENQLTPSPKTFKIKIVDKELINETGGIVQGMSGTPILQDGKIIGAISHALENNPQIGYGVYIKWML